MPRPSPPAAVSAAIPGATLNRHLHLAQQLHQAGRLSEAQRVYQEILRHDPRHPDATHYLGLIAWQSGRRDAGIRLIRKAITLRPAYPEALSNLGAALAEAGRPRDALGCFDQAIALAPRFAPAHDGRGSALRELGQPDRALASHAAALALRPEDAGFHNNQGNACRDLGRHAEALASYDRALALEPGFAEACCNRAATLHAMGRLEEALAGLGRLSSAEAHLTRGNILRDLRRAEEALESFTHAAGCNPAWAAAHDGLGSALHDLGRDEEAVASHGRAIALRPDLAAAWYNRGNAHAALNRMEAALADYGKAVTLNPDHAGAWCAQGLALAALRRHREALGSYRTALRLDPAMPWLLGEMALSCRAICDWTDDAHALAALERCLRAGEPAATPFAATALLDLPGLQRTAAEHFARQFAPSLPPSVPRPPPHRKIRLAYVSADFRDHAMMHLLAGLFEAHDRSRFELCAISLGTESKGAYAQRVAAAFDHVIAAQAMADGEVVALARARGIDIAIDLMGYTAHHRAGLFHRRLAPVQVNWLGYPGTTGAACIDYIIADSTLIPPSAEAAYSERITFLPDTYQPNDRLRAIEACAPGRAGHGLPEDAFVFCCFSNVYKVTPEVFAGWMRILRRVPRGVLWLLPDDADAAANLRDAAAACGVAPGRLVFADRLAQAQHLARHRLADLFLDTHPYNAHTTASDALGAGLPVLTRLGLSFAARVAASLLRAVGLPELVAATQQEYEALAVTLTEDPGRLGALRERLHANRLATALFDTARFTRHLEAALETMHERDRACLPAASFHVPALRDPATVHTKPAGGPDAPSKQNL